MTASEFSWSGGPVTALFVITAAIGAMGIVGWLYRREALRRKSSRPLVVTLFVLRTIAVAITALILLGPVVVPIERHVTLPPLVILRDVSQSMGRSDRYAFDGVSGDGQASWYSAALGEDRERLSRLELLARLVQHEQGHLLQKWATLGRLRLLDFDTAVHDRASMTSSGEFVWPDASAAGRGTDLAQAIRAALAGEKPTAIVLLTDGQHTGPNAPTAAAVEAGEQGVPLLIAGVGDPTRPRNLAVTAVHARTRVWKEEPLEIEAWLASQQIGPGSVTVTLLEQELESPESPANESPSNETPSTPVKSEPRPVATQTVVLRPDGGSSRVVFQHAVSNPGRVQFLVRVAPATDEANREDNERSSLPVEVLDRERLRVLVVGGAPTWDFQLLQRQLSRDTTLETSFWLQSSEGGRAADGTRRLESFPGTAEEIGWYDVLLLVDPDPEQATSEWYDTVKRFAVEQGGGVLYLAGPRFATRWIAADATLPVRELLPVTWPDAESLETRELLDAQTRGWPMRFTPAAWDHPLLRVADNVRAVVEGSDRSTLVFWSLPIETVRPTAQVLLEHGDPAARVASGQRPLLVVDRFGSARVAYLGSQGTWRWRVPGDEASWGEQFWSRAVRYLAEGRAWEGQRRGWLQTDRDHYEIGDRIVVSAQINSSESLGTQDNVRGTVHVAGEEQALRFVAIADQPGRYEAVWTARRIGAHRFRWLPEGPGSGSTDNSEKHSVESPLETTALVEWPRLETESTWLDRERLRELAQQSGGQYRDWWQIEDLTSYIPDRREVVEWRRRPMPLWDRASVLMLLVLVVGLEWGLRRRYKWQ